MPSSASVLSQPTARNQTSHVYLVCHVSLLHSHCGGVRGVGNSGKISASQDTTRREESDHLPQRSESVNGSSSCIGVDLIEPVSRCPSVHGSFTDLSEICYVDRGRCVIHDGMLYSIARSRSRRCQRCEMADFKVYLLHWCECNQKTNGELWYSQDDVYILTPQIFFYIYHLFASCEPLLQLV